MGITEADGFELREVVAVFTAFREDAPKDFCIRVYKTENETFYGECNYAYWGIKQAFPYISSTAIASTPLEAATKALDCLSPNRMLDKEYCWSSRDRKNVCVSIDGEELSTAPWKL